MIIINTGVPKSATTLLFDYQKDIISKVYNSKGLEAFERMNNGSLFVQDFDVKMFNILCKVHDEFGSLVIKTHEPPNEDIKRLIEIQGAKVTCCYRDPRDVILSAIDHGKRTRKGLDKSGAFRDIYTVEDAAKEFVKWSEIYFNWNEYGNVLMVKYESFINDKINTIYRVLKFLGVHLNRNDLLSIHYKQEELKTTKENFNKGVNNRWKNEMSVNELGICNNLLSEIITNMGYTLT